MQNILKSESFVKYNNIKINNFENELYNDFNNRVNFMNKKIVNVQNKSKNINFLKHQDYILNMLLELRNFDEKNGTELFKNISYNNLNTFILKNTV
jgi:hypothetical protein